MVSLRGRAQQLITLIGLLMISAVVLAANPAVQNQRVYLAHQGLLCFDLAVMDSCWQRHDIQTTLTDEPVLTTDTVLLGTSTGLSAYNVSDGSLRWQHNGSSRFFKPSADSTTVYAGSEDGTLFALRLTDGTVHWQRKFDGWVYAPAITKNNIVIAGQEPLIRALNPATGNTLWEYSLAQEAVHYPVYAAMTDSAIVTDFSGAVWAFNAATGALQWQQQDSSPSNSPMLAGTRLYFRTFAGPVLARDVYDGRELWRNTEHLSAQPLAAAGNHLFTVDEYGAVAVLSSSTGKILRRYQPDNVLLGGALIGSPVYAAGRLIMFRTAGGSVANTAIAPLLTVIQTTTEEQSL